MAAGRDYPAHNHRNPEHQEDVRGDGAGRAPEQTDAAAQKY